MLDVDRWRRLVQRAATEYFRTVPNPSMLSCVWDQPGLDSGVVRHAGKEHVVLRNDIRGTFAVFRVLDHGRLERVL